MPPPPRSSRQQASRRGVVCQRASYEAGGRTSTAAARGAGYSRARRCTFRVSCAARATAPFHSFARGGLRPGAAGPATPRWPVSSCQRGSRPDGLVMFAGPSCLRAACVDCGCIPFRVSRETQKNVRTKTYQIWKRCCRPVNIRPLGKRGAMQRFVISHLSPLGTRGWQYARVAGVRRQPEAT